MAALLLWPVAVSACQIPVFRYAIERWAPAAYPVVIFHRGPLSAADRAAADTLADVARTFANVEVTEVDVGPDGGKRDKALDALWKAQSAQGEPPLPHAVVLYPDDPAAAPLWAGKLDGSAVPALVDSPARREVANRLLGGESAVWVLVQSGDAGRDDAAAKLLEAELAKQAAALKLPDIDPNAPGPQIVSEVPLKLAFSVLRIGAADERERSFAAMLTHGLKPEQRGQPALVPVFGQGRALCTLVGEEIEPGAIAEIAKFLVGECSCQVKELNPGFDLLMAVDWRAFVENRKAGDPDLAVAPSSPRTSPATRPAGPRTRPVLADAAALTTTTRPAAPTSRPVAEAPYVAAASLAPVATTAPPAAPPVAAPGTPRRTVLLGATAAAGVLVIVLGALAVRSSRSNGRGAR